VNWGARWRIFLLFIFGNLFLNYDNGVIPACLLQIERDLQFGYRQMALLGSLVYFGLSVSSLFVSPIFQKFNANWILAINMMGNGAACYVFSISSDMWVLYSMRFALGFTQAFCVIYAPVWVNDFSPRSSSTKWMALLHSFVAIGVIVGYILGAIVVNYLSHMLTWRFAFQLQAYASIFIGLLFLFSDNNHVDIYHRVVKEADRESDAGIIRGRVSSIALGGKSVRMDTINLNKNELSKYCH